MLQASLDAPRQKNRLKADWVPFPYVEDLVAKMCESGKKTCAKLEAKLIAQQPLCGLLGALNRTTPALSWDLGPRNSQYSPL